MASSRLIQTQCRLHALKSLWMLIPALCSMACGNTSWHTINNMPRTNDIFEARIVDVHIAQSAGWANATLHVTAKREAYVLPSMSSFNSCLYLVSDDCIYASRRTRIIDPLVCVDDAMPIGLSSGYANIPLTFTPGDGQYVLYAITPLGTWRRYNLPKGKYRLFVSVSLCYTLKDPNIGKHSPPDILSAAWIVEDSELYEVR